jgi:Zn-dependent peptidase ImmA (M78 family)
MAHELKHHLADRMNVTSLSLCSSQNETAAVEIGAEVFAAELLLPEQMFLEFFTGADARPMKSSV